MITVLMTKRERCGEEEESSSHEAQAPRISNSQKRYCTTEKELLALILALQYFDIYVAAAGGPITVFMDHNPLTFLHKLKNKDQLRLMRWSLLLQQYCLDIIYRFPWLRLNTSYRLSLLCTPSSA